ncbi:MATE family efflux transporter [uncultured Clostridium sp.]|uniref:MATE family efflux transporter n=1 Tax=uncultured Clostridium sp. TaxID=59620 RepID=UPI0025E7ED84|nr:MATE family efflux transporter [uncultured Clostridium sp.]
MISYINEMISDRKFIRKSMAIMIPVAAQAMLNTILNLVDTMMIGQLGQTEIAAVGLANKVFFVFTLLLFGIVSGSSILTAQYWGKKDIVNIHKVLGMSIAMSVAGSIIFVTAGIFAPKGVMRIFTPSENTIAIGAAYLGIAAMSYPMTAVTNCYISLLRGVNKVKAPVIISIFSIGINILLNYTLIFGNFGAPQMGVRGAAIATLIARIIECLCIVGYVYIDRNPAAAKIKELFRFNADFIRIYFKTVSPVIANEFMWGLGVTMYSLVYGRMGDEAVASVTITQNVEQLCIVFFQGISAATAVILGNELGANKLDKAEKHATYFIIIQFILTLIMAVVFYFSRSHMIKLFVVTESTAMDIRKCLLVFIIYLPFRMFNLVNITGILRSGGDTTAALLLDITGVWCVGIPLAFLGGIVLGLPVYYVYAMVTFEEAYKFVVGFRRYKKKKWLKNLVDCQEEAYA